MDDWLNKTSPGTWAAHHAKVFMSTLMQPNAQGVSPLAAFNQLYDIPEVANSPAAQKLLKQIAETINNVSDAAKKGGETEATRTTGNESQKLASERRGLNLEKLNMRAAPAVSSSAEQAFTVAFKGITVSKEAKAEILKDIKRQFNQMQLADATFQENAKALLDPKDHDRFLKVLKSAIARNMPKAAMREARKYKGLSGGTQRKAEGQSRVESGGGVTTQGDRVRFTGPWKQGGPDPALIDYGGMRTLWGRKGTDEHLGNHEFLKKGGDGKTIYFW
jgi:hypothetical protein